jgi:hypothetical protein
VEKRNAVSDGNVRNMYFHLTKNAEKKDARSTFLSADYSMQPPVLISNSITTNERYFLKLVTHS